MKEDGCGKIKYDLPEEAKEAGRALLAASMRPPPEVWTIPRIGTYFCIRCGAYHWGHRDRKGRLSNNRPASPAKSTG
jgi:hypothetical protein